jgi:hypothetical protein
MLFLILGFLSPAARPGLQPGWARIQLGCFVAMSSPVTNRSGLC